MNLPATRGRNLGVCLLVLAAVSGAEAQSRAEPFARGQLLLEWNAPADCPSSVELLAAVARLLGGTVSLPAGRTIKVRATVAKGDNWRVEIETAGAEQRLWRHLESPSCPELADATALLVALMIHANAVPAGSAQPASPPATATAAGTTADRKSRATSLRLGLLGSAGVGVLPGLDAGVGGSLGLVRSTWRFDLRASYGLRRDQTVTVSSVPGAYGRFNYTGAVAAVCRNFERGRVDLGACAELELGVLTARGYNFAEGMTGKGGWFGLGPAGYLAIRAGRRLSFPMRATLMVPVSRPEFVFNRDDQTGSVWRGASVSGKLSMGVELHF